MNTGYAKLWAVETSNFFTNSLSSLSSLHSSLSLFTFCLIEIISPYLNFNLFNYVLIIEKNLLFIQTAEYMVFILFLCMILCFITVLRIHYTPIQTEIHGSEIKRHKHGMRNILLGIQFFICWVFVAFTVALYMQAEKTESTLFNTLTEKRKKPIY